MKVTGDGLCGGFVAGRHMRKEQLMNVVRRVLLVSVVVVLPRPAAGNDRFEQVAIVGDTNLTSGSLTNEQGETIASGAVGLLATSKSDKKARLFELAIAFSFGDDGSTVDAASDDAYVAYLQAPSSSLGGFVRARLFAPDYRETGVRFGGSLVLRTNAVTMQAMETPQKLNFVAIDPSATLLATLDRSRNIAVAVDAGVSLRFWNKPKQLFTREIGIDDSHVYFGPRITAALQIGDVHVGVELTRFWGGELDTYKEFTILPYVGVKGGINLKEKTPTAGTPSADDAPVVAPAIL